MSAAPLADGWQARLAALLIGGYASGGPLDAGAASGGEIVRSDAGGVEVWRSALARGYRLGGSFAEDAVHDPIDAEQDLCWLRPLVAGYPTAPGRIFGDYAFHLDVSRPRGLPLQRVDLQPAAEPLEADRSGPHAGRDVVFALPDGGALRVQPARGDQLTELHRWDTFTRVLSSADSAALDELQDMGQWIAWA